MNDNQRGRLKELSSQLRMPAADGGSMHPLWEDIFDFEAFLDGRATFVPTTGDELLLRAEQLATKFLPFP